MYINNHVQLGFTLEKWDTNTMRDQFWLAIKLWPISNANFSSHEKTHKKKQVSTMGWSRLTLPYKSWKMCHAGLTFFFCLQYSISRSTLGGGPFIQLVKCIMRNKRKLQSPFVEKNQSQHLYAFYEASFIFGARTCTLLGFVVVLVLLDCVE